MTTEKGQIFGARHLQAVLLFLAIVICYATRLSVSISLVAMTDAATTNLDFPEFEWTEKQKSYILSSFFWGYVVTQFPGAYCARKFGTKASILFAVLGASLCNLLVPFCVTWGDWQIYCVIRVVQGLFQGFLFPSVHTHFATWSPAEERNRLGAFIYLGANIGTVGAMSVTGLIAASSIGWPGISYVYGGIGIGFCMFWLILAENDPASARLITSEERKYILSSQSKIECKSKETKIPIPWKAILTSVPFLSLIVVRISQAWGATIMQAQLPAYLHGVLNMNIKSNALFSALPYVSQTIFETLFLFLAEIIQKNKWATLSVVRKSFNTIAMWGPAALLIGIGFLGENHTVLAIVLLSLNLGLNGGNSIGSFLNSVDLSPNHAGILMGIANTATNIIPIITPLVVGVIVSDQTQRTLWQIIFSISAGFFFFGNLQYIILGSTDTQIWNDEGYLWH